MQRQAMRMIKKRSKTKKRQAQPHPPSIWHQRRRLARSLQNLQSLLTKTKAAVQLRQRRSLLKLPAAFQPHCGAAGRLCLTRSGRRVQPNQRSLTRLQQSWSSCRPQRRTLLGLLTLQPTISHLRHQSQSCWLQRRPLIRMTRTRRWSPRPRRVPYCKWTVDLVGQNWRKTLLAPLIPWPSFSLARKSRHPLLREVSPMRQALCLMPLLHISTLMLCLSFIELRSVRRRC
mmetsp:Transcript_10281/g.18325  ORF Transcript_10281/g.18325 Transcript_10281/m.18325 type:complete len:230 (-) Transcript_10281:714-1403(-)